MWHRYRAVVAGGTYGVALDSHDVVSGGYYNRAVAGCGSAPDTRQHLAQSMRSAQLTMRSAQLTASRSAECRYGAVAGGYHNRVTGDGAAVSGGARNNATGEEMLCGCAYPRSAHIRLLVAAPIPPPAVHTLSSPHPKTWAGVGCAAGVI
jgi:hypothetical protein